MRKNLILILLTISILTSCTSKNSGETSASNNSAEHNTSKEITEVFITPDGAVNGYDVVAYFKENKPVKGDKKFEYRWKDASWYFASEANLNEFKMAPEKYAPQYGGYCAFGTANGKKAKTEPETWAIVDGKLYLNFDDDVKEKWMKDQHNFIQAADRNWSEVKKRVRDF